MIQGLTLIGAGVTLPAFLGRSAKSLSSPAASLSGGLQGAAGGDRPILVVLQLAGGNDGLNTIIPYSDDAYYRARPKLGLKAKELLNLDDRIALHGRAKGLKRLWDDGQLAIVQGVGYPNPNRSHFVSTDIWETADPKERTHSGWIGRYFDNCCAGSAAPDPKMGIAITREDPVAMNGEHFRPIVFKTPDHLLWTGDKTNKQGGPVYEYLNRRPDDASGDRAAGSGASVKAPVPAKATGSAAGATEAQSPLTTLDYLRRVSYDARVNVDLIREAASGGSGPKNDLDADLEMILRMIRANLPTRVYYASLSGFDTHSGQSSRHDSLMEELGDALSNFQEELQKDGLLDRVILMTFSEFGRRVQENASGGTDHGVAAPLFIVGGRVKGGLYGRYPSLTDLDEGDLKPTTDFRSVYATILGSWMGGDDAKILGGKFPKLNFLKT